MQKILSILLLLLLVASAFTQNVYVKNIDSTGKTDVTKQINDFFRTVRDGSVVHFAKNGKYKMDGVLLLTSRSNIEIDGHGSLIFAVTDGSRVEPPSVQEFHHQWPRKRSQIAIRGGKNISISNLVIKGGSTVAGLSPAAYNSKFEAQHGIDAEGISGLNISNVRITDIWGDFVYLGRWSAGDESWTRDVVIRNCHFERNGRQGVALVGASNVLIEKNYVGYTRRSTFDIEPDDGSTGSRNITIRNNTVGPGILLFIAAGGQPALIENVIIDSNRLVGKTMNMTIFTSKPGLKRNWRIAYNTSDSDLYFNSPIGLINVTGVEKLEIIGNKASITPTTDAIRLEDVCGYKIEKNAFNTPRVQVAPVRSSKECRKK